MDQSGRNALEVLRHCSSFRHIPMTITFFGQYRCKLRELIVTSFKMSSGASGSDENISASKIDPLASEEKHGVPHDTSSGGVTGTDRNIDQSRIDPMGGKGQYCQDSTIPPGYQTRRKW